MSVWSLKTETQTLLFEPASLLDEAHEGCDPGARADHDDWVCGFERETKLRLADVHGHRRLVAIVCDELVLQPVSGHPVVDTVGLCLVLHHNSTDVNAVGMYLQKSHIRRISAVK